MDLARKSRFSQRGQGMTEYIIIVALVAVAAITVYNFFGLGATAGGQAQDEGDEEYTLGEFTQEEE
jgi:hypothetical protein